jgi:hypothetical protein
MSDKDLLNGKIGSEGTYDVAIKAGKIVVSSTVVEPMFTATASVSVSGKQILDAMAAKIGGPIPAEVASFIETTLGLA